MSNDKTTVAAVPDQEQQAPETEKPSFLAKTKSFVKTHKKPAIAVGLLAGLVGVAAVTGRKTEPLPDFDAYTAPEQEPAEADAESTDTTVA